MGRPIKKIFIGERGAGSPGGEGVASVATTAGDSSGYTDLDALTITPPDLVGGVQAVGHVLSAAGAIDSAVITEAGSGYTSAPTVTAVTGGSNTTATLTATLTTGSAAVIAATAYIATANESADMIAQKGATTYRVETATDGVGECSLVASVPNAVGEMAIVATDSAGGTYYVMKLYNNTVYIVKGAGTGTQFADGAKVKWADTAVLNESVKITS